MTQNSQQRMSTAVAFGQSPKNGSKAMPQTLDFTAQASIDINLTFEQDALRLEYVQSIYIDNSANMYSLRGVMNGTGQIIIIPPGSQAYMPVLATSDNAIITFTSPGSTPKIPVNFLNFPVPAIIWATTAYAVQIAGSTGLDYSANQPAVAAHLLSTVPANPLRNSVEVQNQSAEIIQVWLDDGNATAGTLSVLLLAPGSGANTQGADWQSSTFKGRVRVYSATAADQVAVHQD